MLDFLDRIRLLPLQTRRRIAGGVALLCTVFLFLFWLGFGPLGPTTVAEESTTPSPIAALRGRFDSLWNGVSSRMTALTEGVRSMGTFIQEAASSTLATSTASQVMIPASTTTVILTDTFITTSLEGGSAPSN